jgi:drug/metabolite transporter (DMT)-like permease
MTARVAASVILALAAAFFFALSNVLEQREAEQVPDELALRPALVADLAHRPWWLAGFGIDMSGYACHAAALAFGSLLFVQPMLVIGLVFALVLRALITGQPLRRRDLVAALVLTAGLALFLLGVSPHGGSSTAPLGSWVIAASLILAAVLTCVAIGSRLTGPPRALFFGMAAGINFGLSAAFTKAFVHLLGGGVISMLQHWEPYALAVTSIAGLILAQSSFQAGSLGASVAALEVSEPVVAAALGISLFHEQIDTHGLGYQLGIAVALIAMFVGVVALSRSAGEAALAEHARVRARLHGHDRSGLAH